MRACGVAGKYHYHISLKDQLVFQLKYDYHLGKDNRLYYALNELSGWDSHTQNEIGNLPSTSELEKVIDANNSRKYRQTDNAISSEIEYRKTWGDYGSGTDLSIQIPLRMSRRELNFSQILKDTIVSRNDFAPELSISLNRREQSMKRSYNYGVSYHMRASFVNLYNLINISDDSNPLYVTKGNDRLKNTMEHRFNGNIFLMPNMMSNHNIDFSYVFWDNFVAQASLFDKATGITQITPQNVGGNKLFDVKMVNDMYLKKNRSTSFHNETRAIWHNSVDFSGTTIVEVQEKSVVHNFSLNEDLIYRLKSNNTKYGADLSAFIHYRHSTGTREGFETINSCDYGGRLNMYAELPWNVRFESKASIICRSGYNYTAMNETKFLWDISVSKSFGERFDLKLDGFDILGQQTNVVRFVNAQACVEQYSNVLRRYALLHLIWKIN